MENKQESEFGKGFFYCIFLFAKHWNMYMETKKIYKNLKMTSGISVETWFNGASDHFYELEIPEKYKGTEIGDRIEKIKSFVLSIGHGFTGKVYSEEDFNYVFTELEEILILIDKENGIEPISATWR